MRLTKLNGRIKNILTKTEVPWWVMWVIAVVYIGLYLAWFGGFFGF